MDPVSVFSPTTSSYIAGRALDKDAFLRLLTTQLQYQDPMEPQSQDQMFGTLSQMGVLEQMTNMNAGVSAIVHTNYLSLIGKEVKAHDADGEIIEGLVQGLVFEEGGPYMKIEEKMIPVGSIISVVIPE